MHMHLTLSGLAALVAMAVHATPILGYSSVAVPADTPVINNILPRGGGDVDGDDDNDGDYSNVPGVAIDKTGSSTSSGSGSFATSAPANFDGCFYNVAGVGKFTSRMHVANASWSDDNFDNTTANHRYFVKNQHDNPGLFRPSQVVVGGLGNLQLISAAVPSTEYRSVAGEIRTAWTDITYGSVRTVARGDINTDSVYGFFFLTPTTFEGETDIEIRSDYPYQAWYTNQYTPDHEVTYPHNTTHSTLANGGRVDAWHEYRLDWIPGKTLFYLDGKLVDSKTEYVPKSAGSWYWNSWSKNGSWSGGPSRQQSTLYINSIDLYVNRTGVSCGINVS